MKKFIICTALFVCGFSVSIAQTIAEAKEFYLTGQYKKALPIFAAEYEKKPTDPSLNLWLGACLFETGGDTKRAENLFLEASKRRVRDSFLYLGRLYTKSYRFTDAGDAFDKYEALLKKKGDEDARTVLDMRRKELSRLHRMVTSTEDIQIIDSVVIDKSIFLDAYQLSHSSGSLKYFNEVFDANKNIRSTVYTNEKETKMYYAQPDESGLYTLHSMEKLMDKFSNEKSLSSDNFGLEGSLNYPYMMADGVTIYFAAEDKETIGGYDLFVSRYNMNSDTYLTPERLNMPFNSQSNDYLLVIDEEKGVGWFASDRSQEEGLVCVYTFIPNSTTKAVESEDEKVLAKRAFISSIHDTWLADKDYTSLIKLARKEPEVIVKAVRDFEFVVNDNYTYYTLNDFKNQAAQSTYMKVIQMKSELKLLNNDIENKRIAYSRSSERDKQNLTSAILSAEKRQEQLYNDIQMMEIQTRNQEIQALR